MEEMNAAQCLEASILHLLKFPDTFQALLHINCIAVIQCGNSQGFVITDRSNFTEGIGNYCKHCVNQNCTKELQASVAS